MSTVERWADRPPDIWILFQLYSSGVRTVITHGLPLSSFVECRDELSMDGGQCVSKRQLTVRKPLELVVLKVEQKKEN